MYKEIRAALVTQLISYTGLPPVAYENSAFTPNGAQYIKENTLWGANLNLTLTGSHEQQIGIYQLTIFTPINTGTLDDLDLTSGLKSHFKVGTRLTYQGYTIQITRVETAPLGMDSPYSFRPLSIYFKYLAKVL